MPIMPMFLYCLFPRRTTNYAGNYASKIASSLGSCRCCWCHQTCAVVGRASFQMISYHSHLD